VSSSWYTYFPGKIVNTLTFPMASVFLIEMFPLKRFLWHYYPLIEGFLMPLLCINLLIYILLFYNLLKILKESN
jgi:hypothetical protein